MLDVTKDKLKLTQKQNVELTRMYIKDTPVRMLQPEMEHCKDESDNTIEIYSNSLRPTQTIMVQLADPAWTQCALEQACRLALKISAEIALLNLVRVQHVGWLGTELGYRGISKEEYANHTRYTDLVTSYGVPVFIQPFQYVTLAGAIVDASEYVQATKVFCTLPVGPMPIFQRIQMNNLQRTLAKQNRQLLQIK